jgi:hypothetical protein
MAKFHKDRASQVRQDKDESFNRLMGTQTKYTPEAHKKYVGEAKRLRGIGPQYEGRAKMFDVKAAKVKAHLTKQANDKDIPKGMAASSKQYATERKHAHEAGKYAAERIGQARNLIGKKPFEAAKHLKSAEGWSEFGDTKKQAVRGLKNKMRPDMLAEKAKWKARGVKKMYSDSPDYNIPKGMSEKTSYGKARIIAKEHGQQASVANALSKKYGAFHGGVQQHKEIGAKAKKESKKILKSLTDDFYEMGGDGTRPAGVNIPGINGNLNADLGFPTPHHVRPAKLKNMPVLKSHNSFYLD